MTNLASRLERLERAHAPRVKEPLFLSTYGQNITAWTGGRNREWTRRPGENAEELKARAGREALASGIMLLIARGEVPNVA